MAQIHRTAVISPSAALGSNVSIGPFCIVEDDVRIGDGCRLENHVIIKATTHLGRENHVHDRAIIGGVPQHLDVPSQVGILKIGNGNTIRENATIHRALGEEDCTTIGNQNLIMVNAHVAHDCQIGDNVIVTNNVLLAGHVFVEDGAFLSGAVAVHQFCRIGRYAMVGGQAHITQDVPPFVTVDGKTSQIVGLNMVGLRRHGVTGEQLQELKEAYRILFRSGDTMSVSLDRLRWKFPEGLTSHFSKFISESQRGCLRERHVPRGATIQISSPEKESQLIQVVGGVR